MKLVNSIFKSLRLAAPLALGIAGVMLIFASVYVHKKHRDAEAFLNDIDLHARNTSGATFYATKKRLFVGQELSRNDIIEHLKTINYVQNTQPDLPGSYILEGEDSLRVIPRLSEFQPITIKFKRNHIISLTNISNDGISGALQTATIEPEPLGAFILSVDGDESSKMFVRRHPVQFSDIENTDLMYSVLGSEDSRYMSHNGTRFERILRSAVSGQGGGSSISAQVIKNSIYLNKTHAIARKIDEVFLASSLEQRMSKQEILTLYMNNVYLGGGNGAPHIYGFLAAAEEYFGKKSIKDLTTNEASVLVAMLPKPNVFLNQVKKGDYRLLTEWRNRVLRRLNEVWPDKYPALLIETIKKEEVRFVFNPYVEQPLDILTKAFVDYASHQQPVVDLDALPPTKYSGLHIYSSIDPDLARAAQQILQTRIHAIERKFPPLNHNSCDGESDRMLGVVVALDPQTGEIITMSGSSGAKDGVNYAKMALNALSSPASTIKPFWVAKALAETRLPSGEKFTAASIVVPTGPVAGGWWPSEGAQGPGRPRTRLASSADDFAMQVFNLVGPENAKGFFRTVTGNTTNISSAQAGLGLGAGTEVSALRLARAYTVFGNSGSIIEPRPISQIFLDGKEITFKTAPPVQAIEPAAAYITTQMMRSVLGYGRDGASGTGRRAFARTGLSVDKLDIAGKTGSGPNAVWMVSVSPRLVVVVSLCYQCHSAIKNANKMFAGDTAAVIWADFIKAVDKLRPDLIIGNFPKPDNVVEAPINPVQGCRSENGMKEFFIKGTEPLSCKDK